MIRKIFFGLLLMWPVALWGQSADTSPFQPLARLPGDNLNPDFSESEALGINPLDTKWWFAWDAGTRAHRTVYVKFLDVADEDWSQAVALTPDSCLNQNADIESFGDSVLIAWESNCTGHFEIMYRIFDGQTWGESRFLTRDSVDNRHPVLYTWLPYGKAYPEALLIWERKQGLRWSRFDGHDWSLPAPILTKNDSDRAANMGSKSILPFMAWEGWQQNNWDIYASWFLPDSNRWWEPIRLTTDAAEDRNPQVAAADVLFVSAVQAFSGSAFIVWQTFRDQNWEIYRGMYSVSDGLPLLYVKNISDHDSADVHPAARLSFDIDIFFVVTAWESNRSGELRLYSDDFRFVPDTALSRNPRYSRFLQFQYWLGWERWQQNHWEIWGRRINTIPDAVEPYQPHSLPETFSLQQNYPNPFNAATLIQFELAKPAHVQLAVFNLKGQLVEMLLQGKTSAGKHRMLWEARDRKGRALPGGVYFIRLKIGQHSKIRKALLLK